MPASDAPWSLLASSWEAWFPLRPPRLALALSLTRPGDLTLDAGCATGSLPRALAAQGRVAHGLDLEPAFLAEARLRAEGVTWHEAGLLDLARTVGDTRFQLITCLGQTLPHLLEEAQWTDFFTQARHCLEPGGHLVIQAVQDGPEPRTLPPLRTAAGVLERRRTFLADDLARFETTFTPVHGEPVHSEVRHRRMDPHRAATLLKAAGLVPDPPLADEAGTPFTSASPGWVLVATRPAC